MRWLPLLLLLLAAPAWAQPYNVIYIDIDDVGACWMRDYTDEYAACDEAAAFPTPGFDTIADLGVTVSHAWAMPSCTPQRATALTGTFPAEHGRHDIVQSSGTVSLGRGGLQAARPNLMHLLDAAGYNNIIFGKWHLADFEYGDARTAHPIQSGFDSGEGSLNQINSTVSGVNSGSHLSWEDCDFVTGVCTTNTTYSATEVVDDAIAALTATEPWFMYLPFQTAHAPHTPPPTDLYTADEGDCTLSTPPGDLECYSHIVEATTTEIGRIFAHGNFNPADTYVIITNDNGTIERFATDVASNGGNWEEGRCKGSVGECGLWVPLAVSGPGIPANQTYTGNVSATDIHATILEMAGVDNPGENWDTGAAIPSSGGSRLRYRSVSMLPNLKNPATAPGRSCIYADMWSQDAGDPKTNWHEAISNGTYKLMRHRDPGADPAEELFLATSIREEVGVDVIEPPYDPTEQAAHDSLLARAIAMNEDGGDSCR